MNVDPKPWRYVLLDPDGQHREAEQITGGFIFDPRPEYEIPDEVYDKIKAGLKRAYIQGFTEGAIDALRGAAKSAEHLGDLWNQQDQNDLHQPGDRHRAATDIAGRLNLAADDIEKEGLHHD